MEKAKIGLPVLSSSKQAALDEERRKLAEELRKDPLVIQLFRQHAVPESALMAHTYRIASWLKELRLCNGCKGLTVCRQKQTGYRPGLTYDGFFTDTVEICPYRIKKEQSETHLKQFLVNDLGPEFSLISFSETKLEDETKGYIAVFKQAIKSCADKTGLYLYGHMGTGKTYLAACAANEIARQQEQVAVVHCPSFMERIRDFRDEEARAEISRLKYASFAVFDDIGAEEYTGRTRSILLSILDARMQSHKMTWFTSNHDLETLQKHYIAGFDGENELEAMRITERIKALAHPLEVAGKNRRFSRTEQ